MLQFVHLTDTHLVAAGETLYGLDPLARLEAAVAAINARHAAPGPEQAAFVLITGDLTHWGAPDAYRALAAGLDRLALPAHLLIGNHDDRAAFRAAFPETPCDPDGFVQSVIDTDELRLILLDTHDPGTAAGRLCAARLRWLAARLAEQDRPVLLALHHPPPHTGLRRMDAIALADPDALWAVLAPHRARIRHMLFGHLHRPVAGSWRGIPFSTIRGTAHQVAFDLARGPEQRVPGSHEPPAYGLVRVDGESVAVHAHDFLDRTATFDL
jgi:3',5'-cyclic AMP phosphodiesterase CpdA